MPESCRGRSAMQAAARARAVLRLVRIRLACERCRRALPARHLPSADRATGGIDLWTLEHDAWIVNLRHGLRRLGADLLVNCQKRPPGSRPESSSCTSWAWPARSASWQVTW